jgi:hypothetical protein
LASKQETDGYNLVYEYFEKTGCIDAVESLQYDKHESVYLLSNLIIVDNSPEGIVEVAEN